MRVEIVEPHGFCAGVTAALRKALALLANQSNNQTIDLSNNSSPVYCLHELVHNELVVCDLKARGMVFVESVEDVPEGATVLFSAHGVSPAVRVAAAARKLKVVDATCPFVERVHKAARGFAAAGLPVVVIGNPLHAEVRGIVGEIEGLGEVEVLEPKEVTEARLAAFRGRRVGLVSQTTMNADEVAAVVTRLREVCEVETVAEVCNATKVRQDAVKAFRGDALLVLGSVNSSNTRRLCEVASSPRVFRAGTMDEVKALDLAGVDTLGVTSGASTPESFYSAAVGWLRH